MTNLQEDRSSESNDHHGLEVPSLDTTMLAALERVREDFPRASHQAAEAHFRFTRAHNVYTEVLGQCYSELGLSIPRFNLLWVLYRSAEKRLSIGELANEMGITAPSAMTMVQALEAEGWLQTAKGTADRRVTFAELSGDCEARFKAVLEEMLHRWAQIWSCLADPEQESLMALLAKLRSSLLGRYIGVPGLAAFRALRRTPTGTGSPPASD